MDWFWSQIWQNSPVWMFSVLIDWSNIAATLTEQSLTFKMILDSKSSMVSFWRGERGWKPHWVSSEVASRLCEHCSFSLLHHIWTWVRAVHFFLCVLLILSSLSCRVKRLVTPAVQLNNGLISVERREEKTISSSHRALYGGVLASHESSHPMMMTLLSLWWVFHRVSSNEN